MEIRQLVTNNHTAIAVRLVETDSESHPAHMPAHLDRTPSLLNSPEATRGTTTSDHLNGGVQMPRGAGQW
ncbi:MAG: hypothetical protein H0X43_02670 [Nitrosospira sp.]|nr:hypothetical protein [Nitrosospira sp.]